MLVSCYPWVLEPQNLNKTKIGEGGGEKRGGRPLPFFIFLLIILLALVPRVVSYLYIV